MKKFDEIPIGMVFGKTTTSTVQALKFSDSPRIEIGMLIKIPIDNGEPILGRVYSIWSRNRLLENEDSLPNLKAQDILNGISIENMGFARNIAEIIGFDIIIIGFFDQNSFIHPRFTLFPGQLLFKATDEFVKQFFKLDSTIEIGKLRDNPTVPALIDYNKFIPYHFSILAMTGAGKSWLAGVIIEELCLTKDLDYPIIILDPHSEYSSLIVPNSPDKECEIIAKAVQIFCPGEINRKLEKKFERVFQKSRPTVTIQFHPADLTTDQLKTLLDQYYGLSQAQSREIETSWDPIHMQAESGNPPNNLDQMLNEATGNIEHKGTQRAMISKLRALFQRPFFNIDSSIDWTQFVRRGKITIIDFASINSFDQQALVGLILRKLFEMRKMTKVPPFLVLIEEAHTFIPSSNNTSSSKPTIAQIASEGRKFGIGLGVISQRPSKLDADVLSQCNTHLIMRLMNPKDQKFVREISEYMTQEDSESISGLANGEVMVLGYAVPFPLFCRVKYRRMKHGGFTPSLKEELESKEEE